MIAMATQFITKCGSLSFSCQSTDNLAKSRCPTLKHLTHPTYSGKLIPLDALSQISLTYLHQQQIAAMRKEKKKANPFLLISIFLLVSLLNTQSDGCKGERVGLGDCLLEEEGGLDYTRRALWGGGASPTPKKRYISYEALRGDNVPCNRPGVPYYNCRVLPKANPYTRGCSVITACRG